MQCDVSRAFGLKGVSGLFSDADHYSEIVVMTVGKGRIAMNVRNCLDAIVGAAKKNICMATLSVFLMLAYAKMDLRGISAMYPYASK